MFLNAILCLLVCSVLISCSQEDRGIPLSSMEVAIIVKLSPADVDELLAGGSDSNIQSERGYTPIIYASGDLRLPGERESLSLEQASRADQIVRSLLHHGADPNLVVPGGPFALNEAIAANRSMVAYLLLEAGADPNGGNARISPLMLAAHHCRPVIASLLLEFGANAQVEDISGETVSGRANRSGCKSIEKILDVADSNYLEFD